MKEFNFKIEKKIPDFLGRAGVLSTPHGDILTPSFVPVGTKATVKAMTPEMLSDLGAQVVLANTYHLYLQPGDEIVSEAGGIGRFMNWQGPTMTDSGGFQVFSLGAAYGKEISKVVKPADPSVQIPERSSADDGVPRLATIGNDGVSFRSHLDGSLHYITPEKSIQIQQNLGADIIFAFDECTSPAETERYQEEALSRTHAWAKRSLDEHKKSEAVKCSQANGLAERNREEIRGPENENILPMKNLLPQALFGIVQGGRSEKLRRQSAEIIGAMDFDGFGIGGSFAKEDMSTAVKWVNEVLPEEKPRHLLGIGEPEDLFMGVENGVDLFDCVAPTRIARNGTLYTRNGKINMMNAQYVKDFTPVEDGCVCYTCTNYTRAYVSHLYRSKEMLAGTLGSIHNVYFINKLVMDMRQAILEDRFHEYKDQFLKSYLK